MFYHILQIQKQKYIGSYSVLRALTGFLLAALVDGNNPLITERTIDNPIIIKQ